MLNPSQSSQAYEGIKRMIVTLVLPPGDVIDLEALQGELGFGRTPVREALQQLERDKLVTIVPRRGMFVTEVTVGNLPMLYESRVVLESYIARIAAARGTEAHWQEMEDALAVAEASDDPEQVIEADRLAHEIMYEAADHPYLHDTLVMLYAQSHRLWYKYLPGVGDMRGAIDEHLAILDALRAGDGDAASQLVEEHIRAFQTAIRDVMVKEVLAI